MRVAVIGGAGYIGSHVVLALSDSGHTPIIFDDLSTGLEQNVEATGAEFFRGDMTLQGDLDAFFSKRKVDAVIHLAALKAAGDSMSDPMRYAEQNIAATIRLLNTMVRFGVDRIVFSSSAAVYGDPVGQPIDEDHPCDPTNFYGFTKLEVERLLQWYTRLGKLRHASLRYFNAAGYDPEGRVWGLEREPQNLFPVLLEAAMGMRSSVEIFGTDYPTPDGTCLRDFVHPTDLAAAHVLALKHIEDAESLLVNLGGGEAFSVRECIDAVQRETGDFEVREAPRRKGDVVQNLADISRARSVLGWEPKYSELDSIVRTMAQAYRKNVQG